MKCFNTENKNEKKNIKVFKYLSVNPTIVSST